jgi:hypothetical protein
MPPPRFLPVKDEIIIPQPRIPTQFLQSPQQQQPPDKRRRLDGTSFIYPRIEDIPPHRPAFLTTPSPQQHEPTPETFSPHRRGERFISGGMAGMMQQWIVETGRLGRGYLNHVMIQIQVDSIMGKGKTMLMIRGGEERFLLINNGIEVESGMNVSIRSPIWEVNGWTVGVDWKLTTVSK